jgi:uncharacterized protein YerC
MALWLAQAGARLRVADTRPGPERLSALKAACPQVEFISGEFTAALLDGVDLVAVSPGLSPSNELAAVLPAAQEKNIPVWGEIEIFAQALTVLKAERDYQPKIIAITGTNGTASVQNVFAASTNITNIARRAVEQSINPSANATFSDFEALIFDAGNVLRAQITFDNGFTDEYSVAEIRALYARYHVSDSAGTLEGYTVIDADSGAGRIAQVVLFAGSGAQVVVLRSDYVQL